MHAQGSDGHVRHSVGGVERTLDRVGIGLVLAIFVTEAVTAMLLFALAPQFPITGLGFSERHGALIAGYALAAYGAAKMPGQPASGWFADRLRPRSVLLGGLILTLPVVLVMARVHSAGVFVLCCGALGLTLAVVWPAMYAAVGLRFSPAFQGRLLALVSAGQLAGTIAGFGLGAVLIDHVSYTATFVTAFFLVALGALMVVLLTADARRASHAGSAPDGRPQQGAFRALGDPSVALLITLILILSAGLAMLQPDLKPYSERVLHLSFSAFGLLLVPPGLVAAALLMPAGYIADRIGRVPPMVAGLLVFCLCDAALPQTRTPAIACAIACVAVAGYVLSLPALNASLLDVSNHENRGLLTGLTTSIQSIGIVLGPLAGGATVDAFGPLAPFRLSAALIAVAVALALLYGVRTRLMAPSAVAAPRFPAG